MARHGQETLAKCLTDQNRQNNYEWIAPKSPWTDKTTDDDTDTIFACSGPADVLWLVVDFKSLSLSFVRTKT